VATNHYFNPFPKGQITSEQLLVEDLVIESMQIYGMDVFYLPRSSRDEVDFLFGEDTLKQYVSAYPVEMYLENVSGMDGEGDFISKFGLEIRDEVSMLVSRLRFKSIVPQTRPNEGDLIYVPLVNGFFEITFVEHENDQAMFYTLGRGRGGNVYLYALKMKKFVFSDEVIDTGIKEIDSQIRDHYRRSQLTVSAGGSGDFIADEIIYQGTDLANATAQAIVHTWSPSTLNIDVFRVQGIFANGSTIIGATSGAEWQKFGEINTGAFDNNPFEDLFDNTRIQNEAADILDFSEVNPFGEP
jgi:hypothetical protein